MKELRKKFERFCLKNRDRGIPNLMLVDVDQNFVFLLQIQNHDVQVIENQAERAHDDQARNRHADCRKGHEAVQKHTLEALAQQITNIILLH